MRPPWRVTQASQLTARLVQAAATPAPTVTRIGAACTLVLPAGRALYAAVPPLGVTGRLQRPSSPTVTVPITLSLSRISIWLPGAPVPVITNGPPSSWAPSAGKLIAGAAPADGACAAAVSTT